MLGLLADEDDPLGFERKLRSSEIGIEFELAESDRAEKFNELGRIVDVEWKRVGFFRSGRLVLIDPCA